MTSRTAVPGPEPRSEVIVTYLAGLAADPPSARSAADTFAGRLDLVQASAEFQI